MKQIRILALLLALALCLAGCGSAPASSGASSGSTSQAQGDAAIPQEALDDVVSYLTDGAYAADDVVTTVGDTAVTAAQALYWTAYQQYYMTYYYYSNYGMTFQMSDQMEDGTTVGQSLLDFGVDTAVAYAVAAQRAQDNGVSLSEENAAALETLYSDNVTSYGEDRWQAYVDAGLINESDYSVEQRAEWIQTEGESFYQHSLMYYATTPQAYQDTFTNIYYFNTLRDNLFGEGGEYAPTEETMADYLPTYIEDNGICWARCILFSTMDCADDAAVAEVQAQAQAVYDELSALSGEELSAAFTERQSQYDTSGYTAGEVQYYTNTDSLVDGFYEGIQALEPGQVGMTEQTDYGYFILLREADQTDDISANAQESYIVTTYDSLISQWTEEYGVSDVAGLELDADAFYTKLSELQQTLSDADTLPTADTSSGDGTTSAGSTSSDGATSGADASSAGTGSQS